MRTYLETGQIPEIRKGQKCSGCSMKDLCMPKTSPSWNVKKELKKILADEGRMIFLGEDMRKLLNTIYVTNEAAYLTLDGENLVCKIEGKEKLRIPFENIENVVCFSYLGCSPALMGKCVEKTIPINFISPQGKFWAKVCGETKGNVFLRVAQIEQFRENGLTLAQNTLAAKFSNTRQLIRRTLHDNAELREDAEIKKAITVLEEGMNKIFQALTIEEAMGIEGYCAESYFGIFDKLITNEKVHFILN